jgi:AcrR family transcriptional regulator
VKTGVSRRRVGDRRPAKVADRGADKSLKETDGAVPIGRPRDAERHGAVLAATCELLREVGYSRLTIDGVAERAAVSRTLIYRWWATKAELVQEALFPFHSGRSTPHTGSFARDLRLLAEHKVDSFSRPEMLRGLPGLHADLVADAELRKKTERDFTAPALERWVEVFERAAVRGDLPAGVDARTAFQACTGLVMRLTQARSLKRAELVEYVTGLLLHGLAGTDGRRAVARA